MIREYYEIRIEKYINKNFNKLNLPKLNPLEDRNVHGIFLEDLLPLIESSLSKDGPSTLSAYHFIMCEVRIEGYTFSEVQILRRILKALHVLKGDYQMLNPKES